MKSKNHKLISIVVPCFNSGKTLERTIESIKNQTWPEKEIILVNDGSNDKNTLEVLKVIKMIHLLKLLTKKIKDYHLQEILVFFTLAEITCFS